MVAAAGTWRGLPGAGAAQQGSAFKAGVDLVNVGVTVTDRKGRLVTGLTASSFELWEDGRRQIIRYFATGSPGDPGPEVHLGLLIDVSASMGEDLSFTKTAAVRFLNTVVDAVDVTVVDFDTEVRVARYEQTDFARLIERIRQQKARGSTALYDAIGVYLDGASTLTGRKIMLLYTDGGDTESSLRLPELIDLLKASDVTLYAIGELGHQTPATRLRQLAVLQQMAETTGGQAFFPQSVKDLDGVYAKVLGQIRAQYTIGYTSTNDRTDGAWRRVEVKIVGQDTYRVRGRKGYYGAYKKR